MSALNLQVRYRPIKIGWCIRENNFEDYKKALQFTHTLWGGFANPLIIVGNEETAVKLVDLYKVDVLYPITDDEILIKFINKFPHLKWPMFSARELFPQHNKTRSPFFLDIMQAAYRYSFDLKNAATGTESLYFINWDEADPLANNIKKITLNENEEVFSTFMPMSVAELTRYKLLLTTHMHILPRPGFYVGNAHDFTDLVNFWNIKSFGIPIVFYDKNFHSRFSELKNVYTDQINKQMPELYESCSSIGVWSRHENDISVLTNIFNCAITVYRDENFFDRNHVFKWVFQENANLLGILSNNEHRDVSIQLPPKPISDTRARMAQHLMACISVDINFLKDNQDFRFPFLSQLNDFFRSHISNVRGVRAEPEGIGVIISENDSNLKLKGIKAWNLLQDIFQIAGIKIEYSDAGIKASSLIKQMGNLENCKVFKIAGLRELIAKYDPTKSFGRSDAISKINQLEESTKKVNFDKYKKLSLEKDRTEISASYVFEWLAKKEIFRAGLDLKCPVCQFTFWRIIDEIKIRNTCEYCGDSFEIVSQLKDKDWRYRFSGILGDEGNQAGAIPVVITLQQLSKSFPLNTFMFIPSVNLLPLTADIDKCESDFIVITYDHKGRVSIVIAECKNFGEITSEDVGKLKKVADVLQSQHIDTYILFSKMTFFTEEEISICKQAQGINQNRIILLTDKDLETNFLYENTKEARKFFQLGVTWEDMSSYTKITYFKDIN